LSPVGRIRSKSIELHNSNVSTQDILVYSVLYEGMQDTENGLRDQLVMDFPTFSPSRICRLATDSRVLAEALAMTIARWRGIEHIYRTGRPPEMVMEPVPTEGKMLMSGNLNIVDPETLGSARSDATL
jgi:hypothetical protein